MSHGFPSPDQFQFDQLDFIASPVFVLVPDLSGVPRYAAFNAHARSVSGRLLSDYINLTAIDVYPGAFGATAYERHCEVLRSGEPMTYQLDLPLAGQTRSVRTTLLPKSAADGSVSHMFGTSLDLTNEQNVLNAKVSFKTIASEMEQFVAMAAHDLRAPIRNMSMIADMLSDGFVDQGDGKIELIAMLDDVAQKSRALIGDVLNHAHAVENIADLSKFNFAALCRDICDVLDPRAHHNFTYTAVELVADRTIFQIALRNIIENALKYGKRDTLNIDVTVQRSEHKGMLDIVMTDSGDGFPDAALAFINGGKFRVDSGYGLLGVRRMVQARGGTMTAENSENGAGAVILFSMPGEWVGMTNSLGDMLDDFTVAPPIMAPKTA